MAFCKGQVGSASPRFKTGRYLTAKGYFRISAGPDRGKYEHRAVVEKIIGGPIPAGMTVEHMDHQRAHNCWQNLMLLDKRIHDAISWASWTRFAAREAEPPEWVTAA
ncbi:MAG: HNH endonuclease [Patescibacteria group bacterium]|nr:HNH endonuclease [Patescibacteria group bacterium]